MTQSQIPQEVREHWHVIDELQKQTDRGTAIIGAAYLEARLADAIGSRFVPGNYVHSDIFGSRGPLATFSGKIDVAYALGLLGEKSHHDLHLIRRIRNDFAHVFEPMTFDTSKIADQCAKLWFPANFLMPGSDKVPDEPRMQFLAAVIILWNLIWSEQVQRKNIGDKARIIP